MQLNQTTLRGILAEILSVDERYVVPKQGNWWNPQRMNANIATWCAYRIKNNAPRTAPFYKEIADGTNSVVVLKRAVVELQFVGVLSEEIALSVSAWGLRADVKTALEKVNGSILYEDLTPISSDFFQEGNNTVLAWNIPDLKILWYDVTDTNQQPLSVVDMGGEINVRI